MRKIFTVMGYYSAIVIDHAMRRKPPLGDGKKLGPFWVGPEA
jgi:hypothetical protein